MKENAHCTTMDRGVQCVYQEGMPMLTKEAFSRRFEHSFRGLAPDFNRSEALFE